VVNEVTGRRLVLARGASNQLGSGTDTPAFSADGDWVAYLDQVSGAPSSLRVTRSSGSVVVAIPGVLSFSWSQRQDELAASPPGGLELLSATGTVLHRWTLARPWNRPVFSPSGNEIAVGLSTSRLPVEGGSLVVMQVRGAQPHGHPVPGARLPDSCQLDCRRVPHTQLAERRLFGLHRRRRGIVGLRSR